MGKNRLFFCSEKGKKGGHYVIASSKNKAKQIYYWEDCECRFEDISCKHVKKCNVEKYKEQMLRMGSPILKEFGLL